MNLLVNQVETDDVTIINKKRLLLELFGVWILSNIVSFYFAHFMLPYASQTGFSALVGLVSHIPQFLIPYVSYYFKISPLLPSKQQALFKWQGNKLRLFSLMAIILFGLNLLDESLSSGASIPHWIQAGWLSIGLMLLFQGVVVGFSEEMMFRPAFHLPLLLLLPKTKIPWPVIITAFGFGAFHLSNFFLGQPIGATLIQAASASILGLIFGFYYQKTRNYIGSALLHNLFDLAGAIGVIIASWGRFS